MRHRIAVRSDALAVEGEHAELAPLVRAVKRALDRVRAHEVVPLLQPERGGSIPAGVEEALEVAHGEQTVGERERLDPHLVARALVVEDERLALERAHLAHATFERDEARRGIPVRCTGAEIRFARREDGGVGRVLPKGVQDVGEHELLVLLFVRDPELDDRKRAIERLGARLGEELRDARVDRSSVRADLGRRRPRDETAVRARVARSGRLVIRIEEERVARIDRVESRRREDERLEEPGGVGAVPLGRARVGHRLELLIFGRQRGGEPLGTRPSLGEQRRETIARARTHVVRSGPCSLGLHADGR